MHSYSLKCQTRPTKTEIPMFLTDKRLSFPLFSSFCPFCTWMCTRFVQNIAALLSLSFNLHYIAIYSFYKWHSLPNRGIWSGRRMWPHRHGANKGLNNLHHIASSELWPAPTRAPPTFLPCPYVLWWLSLCTTPNPLSNTVQKKVSPQEHKTQWLWLVCRACHVTHG